MKKIRLSSMQRRPKNLETSFSPRMKVKTSALLEKLYKTEKRTGKGGDLCGFNRRTKSAFKQAAQNNERDIGLLESTSKV